MDVTGNGCVADAVVDAETSSPTTAELAATTTACPEVPPEVDAVCCSDDGMDELGSEVDNGGANSLDEVAVNDGCPNTEPPDDVTCVGADTAGTIGLPNRIIPDCDGVALDITVVADTGVGRIADETI